MAPPHWAKEFMRFKWAGDIFNDDTDETEVTIGGVSETLSLSHTHTSLSFL
jgi:hypothetical protein